MVINSFFKWCLITIVIFILSGCNSETSNSNIIKAKDNKNIIVTKLQPSDPKYVIYEDGEDSSIDRWSIYDKKPEGATVSNIYDDNRSSRVIELKGDGIHNGYMIGNWGGSKAWNNREDSKLEWSMKCSENYRIYIRVLTKKGSKYIEYSPKDIDDGLSSNGKNIRIGLGESSKDGTWQTFTRDLSDDLKKYDSDNELISVNGFLIKANARVDDIKMLKSSKEIYEDGEDGTIDGWSVEQNGSTATITNIYDNIKNSKVIEFAGDALNSSYILGAKSGDMAWENSQYQVIKWSMNYSQDFEILINLKTLNGDRYLSYTPTNKDGGLNGNSINYALGEISKNGTWQTFIRDLDKDLQKYDSGNKIIQVNAFIIKGSGKIDDIEMLKREKRVYFNGDDNNISAWDIYDKKPEGATITAIYDNDKSSNVVELNGDGIHNGYRLGSWSGDKAWYNREQKVLKWSMKYSEDFRISIRLDTKDGERYLEYSPTGIDKGASTNGKYIRYGLGVLAKNGTWQTFVRDLDADLKAYQSSNEIISVNGFFIKGSGLVDDVELLYYSPLLFNNIPPTIKLNGANPTKIIVGESYSEQGAVVTDDRDSDIKVTIDSSSIDTSTIGQYFVTYTAVDNAGNIATKERTVMVVGEDKEPPTIHLTGGNPVSYKQGAIYNEEGVFATDDVDDSVTVTISGNVDTNTIGSYIITYTAKDRFGNVTTKIRRVDIVIPNDPKYSLEYRGLKFYSENMPTSNYRLEQLSSSDFNALTKENKLIVADKILGTLFFGYPQNKLEEMIDSGSFIDDIQNGLNRDTTDKAWLESYILDEEKFKYSKYSEPMDKNLNRFYAMKELDSYFFNNWIAYTLTQTILFSPAYELDTSEIPNVSRVYNNIVKSLQENETLSLITYKHTMSEDNWRRFRSPEDNGREMLEIYTLDFDDRDVPLSAKALQNWSLNPESNTLVIELNENIEPIGLFGTTIFNGEDFYREMVKSNAFIVGVTTRLVNFLFSDSSNSKKSTIINSIVSSNPQTFRDIFEQIIFSKAYLLNSNRPKKGEETFFSLAKKMDYQNFNQTAKYLRDNLEKMHQATMKYKLGKLEPVPLDTLSFANYHKYIREFILTRKSDPKYSNNYDKWGRQGWSSSFISFDKFNFNEDDKMGTIDSLINLIFKTTVDRVATDKELELFHNHFYQDGKFPWQFNMFVRYDDGVKQREKRERARDDIAKVVLAYISRLEDVYKYQEVK